MFRTVLVPLDGSEQAEQALPYAVRLARAAGGQLVLVRAALGPPPSGQNWEQQQASAITEATTYLAGVQERLATRLGVATVVKYGHAPAQILQAATEFSVDAIVMSTRGRTGPAHLLFGSVAERIVADAPIPVLLVHTRTGEAPMPPFDPPAARILVPLDGSPTAEAALPVAREVLGIAGELVLLTLVSPPDHVERDERGNVVAYLDQQEEAKKRLALDYLADVVARMKADDPALHVTREARVAESAPAGIALAEIERGVDLVVMATHGRTGFRRALVGSVAGEVVRNGHAPTLLVPPHLLAARPAEPVATT